MNSDEPGIKVVLCTTSGIAEAEKLAGSLVEAKLAACCNIIPAIRSVYFWDGKVRNDEEALLIIKTADENLQELTQKIKGIHSYDLPEIISISVDGGSAEFIKWVKDNS
ncbi:MAG: divalent cation tolerance protein CutA [candidate division Zixibacteria bacterium]|nr:divalent cation tolerance protein CutA [candidate division Zixibacteria bacterium]